MTLPQIQPDKTVLNQLRDLYISCLVNVFKAQFDLVAKPGAPCPPEVCKMPAHLDLASTLSVTSKEISGSLSLAFPPETFLKLAGQVFGAEFTVINEENRDLAAELLNMSFGMTKTQFSASHNIVLQPAIPMIVQGKDVQLSLPKSSPTWLVAYDLPVGRFFAVISLQFEKPTA